MRRYLFFLMVAFFVFSNINVIAINPEITSKNEEKNTKETLSLSPSESNVRLKLINIQVDPLGFLFFGPQAGVDIQVANFFAIGPYVRWNYAGLLYQASITDWFTDNPYISPGSYGVGISAKIIPPTGSGKHRPYVDLGFERFKGEESWSTGGTLGDHIYQYKANIFHIGAGYRLVTEGSFNLSVGIFMGIYKEIENIDYYEVESEIDHNSLSDPVAYPGLQLQLGWQLGK